MSELISDNQSEVDSILEEVLTPSIQQSTQSDLPELENVPLTELVPVSEAEEDFEMDIPLPNDPNEIPLPADIPNQPPSLGSLHDFYIKILPKFKNIFTYF